jgi:uncharacterized membrane protein YjgN (DUF898 family)
MAELAVPHHPVLRGTTSVPTVVPVAFSGNRGEFGRLVARGALLELVTLGFYRFWLMTDMRRHWWSHTSVGSDALEYTGTAKELLIGFLVALAIVLPVNLIYFLIGLEAERLQAFASIPLVLFFYLFAQFAIYRARRYRLTRTIWRGVRFWMTGSGWAYAWRAGLWALLVTVTLGLALPWYQAALERYKMRHTHYGDLAGRFDGTGWEFFKQAGWLWFAAVATLILISVSGALNLWPAAVLLVLFAAIGSPFAYCLYKAAEWRWWVSGIRFGEVRFESKLPAGALIGLYWKVIGWSALLLFALSGWGGVVFGTVLAIEGLPPNPQDFGAQMQRPAVLIALVLGYLTAAVAFGVVVRVYLRRDVWARVVSSTVVHNPAAAYNVSARGEAAGSLGEGLADSLDVGGF